MCQKLEIDSKETIEEKKEFKKLKLENIDEILPFLKLFSSHLSDFTVGGIFMWREFFNIQYLLKNEALFFKLDLENQKNVFTFPIGGNLEKNIDFIKSYCEENKIPLIFSIASDRELEILKNNYEIINVTHNKDWDDYFYLASDLIDLKGRKFNTQRNHINKFNRTYQNYRLVEIDKDNIDSVIEFIVEFYKEYEKVAPISIEEKEITFEFLKNYFIYNLLGAVLMLDSKIIGLSIGEIINDTLFIHIEKADRNYQGSYQVLNNEFAKYYGKNITYINREEDVGDEGLRRAKEMYNPIELLKKYIVEVKI